jgi:hypothetical protein
MIELKEYSGGGEKQFGLGHDQRENIASDLEIKNVPFIASHGLFTNHERGLLSFSGWSMGSFKSIVETLIASMINVGG